MNKNSKILIGVLSVVAIAGVAFGLGGKGLQGKIALNDLPFSIKVTSSQAETVMNGTKNAGVGTWYISAKKEIQINELTFALKEGDITTTGAINLAVGEQKVGTKTLDKSKTIHFQDVNYTLGEGKENKIYLNADINAVKNTSFQFVLRQAIVTETATGKKIKQAFGEIGPMITVISQLPRE